MATAPHPLTAQQPAYGQVSGQQPGPALPNPASAPSMVQHAATAPQTMFAGWAPSHGVGQYPVYVTMPTAAPGPHWLSNPLVAVQSLPNLGMQHPSLAALVYPQPPGTQPRLTGASIQLPPQLLGQHTTNNVGGSHSASMPPLHTHVQTVAPGSVMYTQSPNTMAAQAGRPMQNETQPPFLYGGEGGLPPLDVDMDGGEGEGDGAYDVGLFEGEGEGDEGEQPHEAGGRKGKGGQQAARKNSAPPVRYEVYARKLDELVKRDDTGKDLALRAFRLRLFFQLVAMGRKKEQARVEIATLCGKGEYCSRQIRRDATAYIATGTLPDVPKHGGPRKKGTSTKPPKQKQAQREEVPENRHIWVQEYMGPRV